MKRMKGIVYGGLLSVVFVMSGCSGSQKEGRDSKEIPVEIVKVAKTVPADTRNYVGTVEEVVSSSISFQVMGNVERVLVGEGQKVREGQLLAVLDKATLENAYNVSAASLRQAEDAYARMRTLHENKSLPDMKWVEVETWSESRGKTLRTGTCMPRSAALSASAWLRRERTCSPGNRFSPC